MSSGGPKYDIGYLDFLRGWLALLVFFHHAAILGGGPGFLSGEIGQEAVNAFMLASGFLIYFQCSISKLYGGLETKKGLKNFFIRRFFRIAPAYYISLIIALLLSTYLGQSREAIAEILPYTSTDMARYYIDEPIRSFFLHITFVFGVIPEYAFSTPLPDWSLGLEAQFYFIFPLLFIFLKKNFLIFLPISLCGMFAIWFISNRLGLHFSMPSYLPLKFHNFAAGIVLAYLMLNTQSAKYIKVFLILVVLFFLYVGNKSLTIPLLFIFSYWWICVEKNKNKKALSILNSLFNHKSSKFLAEISYSLYIIHLVIMLPFFAFFLNSFDLSFTTWFISTAILLLITIVCSYFMYRFIEIPGINYGKKLTQNK
ncbi:acyltransferase [Pseudoalteromonas sp. SWXJZ94C]|uniref:acyltransferase family protein n=1 Tax=unclassified Pseudoalteromonas TaxID=194690 RepID=UPI00140E445A|nr:MULTISPECIES: acyltransferase [unclassified Pseudoalteromonas]MBH0057958.1 acyltransferase [Pseudoalteromonas sp. SWXJZ94C]